MLNKVILMGRLTKDPEMKSTQSGVSVCTFTLAVDRRFIKQGEEKQTDFIYTVAWRERADFANKYFRKGQLVAIVGSLQTRTWDDQNGVKHYATEVVADELHFAESKQERYEEHPPVTPNTQGFSPITGDDDLPF